jgi:glutamine amidotransferase-like uncharacterized protein
MKQTIALFVHQPMCSTQSGNGIIKALSSDYNFKIFSKHTLEKGFFDEVDMVAFPGGFGNSDSYDYLLKNSKHLIKNFVNNGGRYLGICMGTVSKSYVHQKHAACLLITWLLCKW